MKAFKWTIIILAVIVALASLIGFMLPRNVHVERKKIIHGDRATIFNLINNPREFQKWSPWIQIDTSAKVEFFGPNSGKGAGFTWTSTDPDVSFGTWTITDAHPPAHVAVDLRFETMDASKVGFMLLPQGEATLVKWTMDADMGWGPFGRIFGLLMEGSLGPDYERGLNNLDSVMKTIPSGHVAKIALLDFPGGYVLGIRDTAKISEIGNVLGPLYGKVMAYMQANNIRMSGPPVSVYNTYDEYTGITQLQAGIPVMKKENGLGHISCFELYRGPVIAAEYYGPYQNLPSAYRAIEKYAKANGKKLTGSPWESYVTEPGLQSDPEKLLTMVYWPTE